MSKIYIYTDGACSGNPGPGGWGSLIIHDDNEMELSGGERKTTNNRMEMMAVIEALKKVEENSDIVLTTDSQYVKNGYYHVDKKLGEDITGKLQQKSR